MARITPLLLQFNKSFEYSETPEGLITYLDEHAPQWREIIKDREEWLPLFEQAVRVSPSSWHQLASAFFDIIDNRDAFVAVWNDEKCCNQYRLIAIRRLREIDESTYLPQYIDWIRTGWFGGWWCPVGSKLFDFDGALEMLLDMATSPHSNYDEKNLGQLCLAYTANMWWDKYPTNVREKVLHHKYYYLIEFCDEKLWSMMTPDERAFLTADIRIASVNDATIHPFLKSVLESRQGNRNQITR